MVHVDGDMPISAKFNQYAESYNLATPIQTDVALFLAQKILAHERLPKVGSPVSQHWVDIGCGTGKLSQAVLANFLESTKKLPCSNLYGVDNSQNMLAIWQESLIDAGQRLCVTPTLANMTVLPFADSAIDVVMSSFALHWAAPSVMAELARVVKQGGRLYLAIVVHGSLSQVKARFAELPIFPFLPSDDWKQMIFQLMQQRQGELQFLEERSFNHLYPSLKVLLKELKTMGGAVSGHSPIQPSLLRQYLQDTSPIALDYKILLVGLTVN